MILKPGGPGSKAALGSKKKGHGRNWAVEGVGWNFHYPSGERLACPKKAWGDGSMDGTMGDGTMV